MIIYKATNKANGKVYIGQSSHSLEWRVRKHKQDSQKEDTYFYRAIRKYGFDNFEWEVIDNTATTHEELNELEKFYIKQYESFDNKNKGYNSTSGGDYAYEITEEEKRNRSLRAQGKNNPMYGKPGTWKGKKFSEEHKKHLSEALKGRKTPWLEGGNNHSAVPIINMTTGEKFDSIIEAAKAYNVVADAIGNNLKGISKTCCGCIWKYQKDIDLENFIQITPKNHRPHIQKVYWVEGQKEFESISQAAAFFKCAHKTISDCIKGKRESYKNNHFISKK